MRLDLNTERLFDGDQKVPISTKAFALLKLFVQNPQRVLSKEEILEKVWPGVYVSEELVRGYVRDLRRALGDDLNSPIYIRTVRGRGYEYIGNIELQADRTKDTEKSKQSLPSIVVLPFTNLTSDPELGYLCDGITDTIITSLAQCPLLLVLSRYASFAYKDNVTSVKLVAQELGARYVLEGSVQRNDDVQRVLVQLIDADTGHHIWAQAFTEDSCNVIDIQDSVAEKVFASLVGDQWSSAIRLSESKNAWLKGHANLSEYDYWMQVFHLYFRYNKHDMARAREIAEQGFSRYPQSALMKVALSWPLLAETSLSWVDNGPFAYKRAISLAEEARDDPLAPRFAEMDARWVLSYLYLYDRRDVNKALASANSAIALAPGHGPVHFARAIVQTFAGQTDEAIEAMYIAERTSPSLGLLPLAKARLAYMEGQYGDAITELLKSNLEVAEKYELLCCSCVMDGKTALAREALAKLLEIHPHLTSKKVAKLRPYCDKFFLNHYIENLVRVGLPL